MVALEHHPMVALITGGAGFIGSHLAEELLRRGHRVGVIDDLSTGSIHNIEPLKGDSHFQYVIDSIFNRNLLAELVDASDVVFHLAAAVGVKLIVERPVRTIETNVKGTELVLEMAAKKKRPVLIASTSEVYGKSNRARFKESDNLVLGPTSKSRWSYAASKVIDEFLALAYWREKGLPIVIARLFNTVGPRQVGRYGMVMPRFVQQALQGLPITVYGTGEQTRSFTWVGDVVGALIALMETPQALGEIFNIGHREKTTILDLAKLTKRLIQSDSPIVFVPYEKAYAEGFEDMLHRLPDITKIGRLIGYTPSKTLSEILESVIADHRTQIEAGGGR